MNLRIRGCTKIWIFRNIIPWCKHATKNIICNFYAQASSVMVSWCGWIRGLKHMIGLYVWRDSQLISILLSSLTSTSPPVQIYDEHFAGQRWQCFPIWGRPPVCLYMLSHCLCLRSIFGLNQFWMESQHYPCWSLVTSWQSVDVWPSVRLQLRQIHLHWVETELQVVPPAKCRPEQVPETLCSQPAVWECIIVTVQTVCAPPLE